MSYRPYPDRDRALRQLERHGDEYRPLAPRPASATVPDPFAGLAAYIRAQDWKPAVEALASIARGGRQLTDLVIVDDPIGPGGIVTMTTPHFGGNATYGPTERQYLAAGHHVHRASRHGVVCLGGDDRCTMPRAKDGPPG